MLHKMDDLLNALNRPPSNGLKCPHCDHHEDVEKDLFNHIKTHQNYLKCRIPSCGRTSKNMNNFCAHWRMHSKERPWVCICGREFSIRIMLKNHILKCPK